MYVGIETSEMPRLSEELVEQEKLKRREIFVYETEKAGLEMHLAWLHAELAGLMASLSVSPAALVAGEEGAEAMQEIIEQINAVMNEIQITEEKLKNVKIKIGLAKSELNTILTNQDDLFEEVKVRALNVKSAAGAGKVTGAYRKGAQRALQFAKDQADKLEKSASILSRNVYASFVPKEPDHPRRHNTSGSIKPFGDIHQNNNTSYIKKRNYSTTEKNPEKNKSVYTYNKKSFLSAERKGNSKKKTAMSGNNNSINSVKKKIPFKNNTANTHKKDLFLSAERKGISSKKEEKTSNKNPTYFIGRLNFVPLNTVIIRDKDHTVVKARPGRQHQNKTYKQYLDSASTHYEKILDEKKQKVNAYIKEKGIANNNLTVYADDKTINKLLKEYEKALADFNSVPRSDEATEKLVASFDRYTDFQNGNKVPFKKVADIKIDRQQSASSIHGILHGATQSRTVKIGRSYKTVYADMKNIRHTVDLAKKSFVPSSRRKKFTQMPDLYRFVPESETLRIAEQKNYSIEYGLDSLKSNIAEQAIKRITNCLNAYATPELTGLSKAFYVKKLELDFNIDVKGHYQREDGTKLTMQDMIKLKKNILNAINSNVSDDLLSQCTFNFYIVTGKNNVLI